MTTQPFDLVIRGGTVGTSTAHFVADVAVKDGKDGTTWSVV